VDCSPAEQVSQATQAIIVCVASSFSWLSLIAPGMIALSVCAAIWGVQKARETARQRATLDMIEKVESTPHYRDLHAAFAYHRRMDTFARLHNPTEEKDKRERTAVLDYLNHYELVSIGIRKRILDAAIYRDWMQGPFVRDWNAARRFIQRERWKYDPGTRKWSYYEPLFANYQKTAGAWSKDARMIDSTTSPPPGKAEGPGDEALPDGDASA